LGAAAATTAASSSINQCDEPALKNHGLMLTPRRSEYM
jgi:hypothetical protein